MPLRCKYGSSLKSLHLSNAATCRASSKLRNGHCCYSKQRRCLAAATIRRWRSEGSSVAASSSCLRLKKNGWRERNQRGRSVLLATATNSPTSPLILFFIRCTRIQSPERCGNPRTLLSPPKSSHLPLNMIARRVTGSCFQIKARRSGVTLFDSLFILVAVGFSARHWNI